jgi:hypothetical protein
MTTDFPDGTFTDPVDRPVDRLSVYVAAQAFAFGRWSSALTVEEVYIGEKAIFDFCKATDTKLPRPVGPEWWERSFGRRSSPPECGQGQWLGTLATLQLVLDMRQGRARGRSPFGETQPLNEIWSDTRARAAELLDGRPDRAAQLAALDAEWDAIRARRDEERRAREATPPPTPRAPAAAEKPRRPVSDRELRDWYEQYVSELSAAGIYPSRARIEAAANAKFGPRVTRERVRKLDPVPRDPGRRYKKSAE